MGIVESASALLSRAVGHAELTSHNIANVGTPGYKRRVAFADLVSPGRAAPEFPGPPAAAIDHSLGPLVATGNPFDLAIAGNGFFVVRSPDGFLYTRQGQFARDGDGRLVTSQGFALQAAGGGDLVVGEGAFDVAADGTASVRGAPVDRVALVDFEELASLRLGSGGHFEAGEGAALPLEDAVVRQGMLESSNVSAGDEMVALMQAVRWAETGQRLVTVYDDLMGRALASLGPQ